MDEESRIIKENAIKLAWHMRGSVTYNDLLNMCPAEREAIAKLIDSNLETTKKTGLPFF